MAACGELATDAIVITPTFLPPLHLDNQTYVMQSAMTGCQILVLVLLGSVYSTLIFSVFIPFLLPEFTVQISRLK